MKNVAQISRRRRRTSSSIVPNQLLLRDVTGVILAGGASSRMGSDKALLPCQGGMFIEAIHRTLRDIFAEVVIITNTPDQYSFVGCPTRGDIYANCGPLAGIHAALVHSSTPHIFAVACDMPFLNQELIRAIALRRTEGDIVVADKGEGPEPLHAVYSRSCVPAVEMMLHNGKRNIVSFFPSVRVKRVEREEIELHDPLYHSFSNINTPEEYFAFRSTEKTLQKKQLERLQTEMNSGDMFLDMLWGGG